MLYKQAIAERPVLVAEQEMVKTASGDSWVHKPHPDCLYLRTRAIGNLEVDGPNANADAFPYGEFLNDRPGFGYKSFIGKKAFIEHQTETITNAVGDLVDAVLRDFNMGTFSSRAWHELNDSERLQVIGSRIANSSGDELLRAYGVQEFVPEQRDGSIEVLMKVDRKRAPAIARQVDLGENIGVSMGTAIAYSECSVCGNQAQFEKDYCDHIAHGKGRHHPVQANQYLDLVKKGTVKPEWLRHIFSSATEIKAVLQGDRRTVYAKAFETNYGLQFYELSFVGNPAFNRGYMLEKVASQQNSDWLKQISDDELLALYANLHEV